MTQPDAGPRFLYHAHGTKQSKSLRENSFWASDPLVVDVCPVAEPLLNMCILPPFPSFFFPVVGPFLAD